MMIALGFKRFKKILQSCGEHTLTALWRYCTCSVINDNYSFYCYSRTIIYVRFTEEVHHLLVPLPSMAFIHQE